MRSPHAEGPVGAGRSHMLHLPGDGDDPLSAMRGNELRPAPEQHLCLLWKERRVRITLRELLCISPDLAGCRLVHDGHRHHHRAHLLVPDGATVERSRIRWIESYERDTSPRRQGRRRRAPASRQQNSPHPALDCHCLSAVRCNTFGHRQSGTLRHRPNAVHVAVRLGLEMIGIEVKRTSLIGMSRADSGVGMDPATSASG